MLKRICVILVLIAPIELLAVDHPQTELLPEIVELITPKALDETKLAGNLYVLSNTLLYPNDDFVKIGQDMIKNNARYALAQFNANIPVDPYEFDTIINHIKPGEKLLALKTKIPAGKTFYASSFPCGNQTITKNCISATLDLRPAIEYLDKENEILRKRYNTIQRLTTHYEPITFLGRDFSYDTRLLMPNVYSLMTENHIFFFFSHLNLAKAIFAIYDGNIDQGLSYIETEYDFLLAAFHDNFALDELLRISSRLTTIHRTLNDLLDMALLDSALDHPVITKIMQNNDNVLQNRIREASFINQQKEALKIYIEILYPSKQLILNTLEDYLKAQQDLTEGKKLGELFFTTLPSKSYQVMRQKLLAGKISLDEFLENQRLTLSDWLMKENLTEEDLMEWLWQSPPPYNSLINEHYLKVKELGTLIQQDPYSIKIDQFFAKDPFKNTALRFVYNYRLSNYKWDDALNYHRVLRLKYEIKRDNIPLDEIPLFLTKKGLEATNLISKEPFQWDYSKQMLSTPLFSLQAQKNNQTIRIYIQGQTADQSN